MDYVHNLPAAGYPQLCPPRKMQRTVCDIMRFSGFILLLVFSIVRSVWRNDIQNPPSANKSGQ